MAYHYDDVRDLIRDIGGDCQLDHSEQHYLPFSRPVSATHGQYEKPRPSDTSTSVGAYVPASSHRQVLMRAGNAEFEPLDTEEGLDEYDSALLAEPSYKPLQQGVGRRDRTNPGRLSSFGPTGPFHSSSPIFPYGQHGAGGPGIARHAYSPTDDRLLSSPTANAPTSSPTIGVRQRRLAHHELYGPHSSYIQPARTSNNSQVKRKTDSSNRGNVSVQQRQRTHLPHENARSYSDVTQPQAASIHATPKVQGIQLISLNDMPDRFRSVFRFPLFNAIQSQCYPVAYQSDDNLVVSAPTGGGKTAILELAICRLTASSRTDDFKVVYMAPTKSLCSERHREWQTKFAILDLCCAELTGDTDSVHLRSVQSAHIIITTPEKWDSMTRKWKDHARLMQMVKLFLIDEVHILREARGATLEAVVSRMKSVGSQVRFVALSATVPNSDDIASWLGKNPTNGLLPAAREVFGEDFRPVKLQKHVVGLPYKGNDFGFEGACDPVLPRIIGKYSQGKPIMIFCITRKSTVSTAKLLSKLWSGQKAVDRSWNGPSQSIRVGDPELRGKVEYASLALNDGTKFSCLGLSSSGVAFHHAGLDASDRANVEKGFLEGHINVICCTSTLAVGVNLPCHFVIIKNTVSYQDNGIQEYSDLEVMQMLGRAGRPQFDSSAVAVIITKQEKVQKYEKLISGQELLESCLHLNLIDHLNAEIGLGSIQDLRTAKRWLFGTFLYVRLSKNPDHYRIEGDAPDRSLDDRVELICKRELGLLQSTQLIVSDESSKIKATEFGDAMARYYVRYETMKTILGLGHQPKLSDILSALVQADEYHDIRFRGNEKKLFKELNRQQGMRFPIKVDLALSAHKRSIIIQSELGSVEFPSDEDFGKLRTQFLQEKHRLFSNIHRLIRCVIDCQIQLEDAVGVRNALELARSLGARVWDNSPFQMKQLPGIGAVAVRKLAVNGVSNMEALEAAEPSKIESVLSKNPPFGSKILTSVQAFPKLRVSVLMTGKDVRSNTPPIIRMKAEIAFLNEKPPVTFQRKPIYICLVVERSDGLLVDFRRMPAKKVGEGVEMVLTAQMTNQYQFVTCYVMCDEIAGTLQHAELKPNLGHTYFPLQQGQQGSQDRAKSGKSIPGQSEAHSMHHEESPATLKDTEYDDDYLDDQELQEFADATTELAFNHIDKYSAPESEFKSQANWKPERLRNGKWACNHACKNKLTCKHFCCREGLDKAPKQPKNAFVPASSMLDLSASASTGTRKKQSTSATKQAKPGQDGRIETLDLANPNKEKQVHSKIPRQLGRLEQLHKSINKDVFAPGLRHEKQQGDRSQTRGRQPDSRTKTTDMDASDERSTVYSDGWAGELPSVTDLLGGGAENEKDSSENQEFSAAGKLGKENSRGREAGDSDFKFDLSQNAGREDLEDALVGLEDSMGMESDVHHQQDVPSDSLQDAYLPGPAVSEKLFLSTDSPERPIPAAEKRKMGEYDKHFSPESSPKHKRPKAEEAAYESSSTLVDSRVVANDAVPAIKQGLPAWVYEYDPAFITQYQDIVEFV